MLFATTDREINKIKAYANLRVLFIFVYLCMWQIEFDIFNLYCVRQMFCYKNKVCLGFKELQKTIPKIIIIIIKCPLGHLI